jgi:glycosyltransferase involved in cell wall biosynthesis
MLKGTLIQRENEIDGREASEQKLANFVLDKAGIPIDHFAVAVILETHGIRDLDAVRKFGGKDVFDLAHKIYDRCRVIVADVPELTVSITAYNKGKCIGEALESILCQEGVEFELIVVDDGSEDNTVEVVQSFEDPRVRLIRNKGHRGFGYCCNLSLEKTKSPFIAYVRADGIVLPGAFHKMVQKLKSCPDIGQVNCYTLQEHENMSVKEDSSRNTTNFAPKGVTPATDHNRELLAHGSITNDLLMYRRDVFIVAGKFCETVRHGVGYDMAFRIVGKYDIKLVPEFLYCSRAHERRKTKLLDFNGVGSWFQTLVFRRLLLKDRKVNFLRPERNNFNKFMTMSLCCILRLANMPLSMKEIIKIPGELRTIMKT